MFFLNVFIIQSKSIKILNIKNKMEKLMSHMIYMTMVMMLYYYTITHTYK